MLMRQKLIYRFLWGMSILNSYVLFNKDLNYQDINIMSENFMRDLLNILYGYELQNGNSNQMNVPGIDLISERHSIIVQVTASTTPTKIHDTLEILERNFPDLAAYTIKFVILSHSANNQKNYQGWHKVGYQVPDFLHFNARDDILDLSDFSRKVNDLDDDKLLRLDDFMKKNANLFIQRVPLPNPEDRIDAIIDEYANNYEAPLFQHTYTTNTAVRLCNLYINPSFRVISSEEKPPKEIVSLFSRFLWQNDSDRMLFIDGDAAIGKTSLISWLCYHYRNIPKEGATDSIGKAIFLDSKLVCVRLRELDFTDKTYTTIEPILSYLGVKSLSDFHRDYSCAIIILDGIDEISMIDNGVSSAYITEFLLNIRKQFKRNKVIITGRPHFFHVNELQTSTFRIWHVNLLHFDRPMREAWIQKYENCGEVIPEQTKQYILSLDDNAAEGVADTPLALYLLTSCEIREELQGNRWALYHEIFRNAIMRTEYNENFTVGTTHPAYKNLDVIYGVVCKIAFIMFQNSKEDRYYITSQELDQIVNNTALHSVPIEWVRQCCVLCAYWKSNSNIGALEFYHNDIRDFFFCEYIYNVLSVGGNTEVLEEASLSRLISAMCEIFQYGYISGTTWAQTFEFLYLRLKYESKVSQINHTRELLSIHSNFLFPKLFLALFTSHKLYGFPFKESCYLSIRRVLFNTTLLLRLIHQTWIDSNPDCNRLCLWENNEAYELLSVSNVLHDWHEIFMQSVMLSSGSSISIGSYMDLSRIKFRNISLANASFSHDLFDSASFTGVNLRRISFDSTVLKNTDFSDCDLQDANFHCTTLINVNFTQTSLLEVSFDSVTFQDCDLTKKTFQQCSFTHTKFLECTLKDTAYPDSHLSNIVFHGAELNQADFRKVTRLDCITFIDCQLPSVNFSHVTLSNVVFQNCDLTRSCFHDAILYDVSFQEGKLMEIDFSQATLSGTDLTPVSSSCNMKNIKSWSI